MSTDYLLHNTDPVSGKIGLTLLNLDLYPQSCHQYESPIDILLLYDERLTHASGVLNILLYNRPKGDNIW